MRRDGLPKGDLDLQIGREPALVGGIALGSEHQGGQAQTVSRQAGIRYELRGPTSRKEVGLAV